MAKIDELKTAVENGKAKIAAQLAQEALDEGSKAPEILDAMVVAMGVVGEINIFLLWEKFSDLPVYGQSADA